MLGFYKTTIGKKLIAAVTGLILVGFAVGHMLGNLKTFMGTDAAGIHALDHYAEFLREMGEPLLPYSMLLWIVRVGLLAAVFLHIVTVVQLTMLNRASRKQKYAVYKPNSSTFASRGMFWGGLVLLTFIVFHILHFTTGTLHFDGYVEGKVYANVVRSFQHWYLVAFYVVAMGALGAHLYHGVWSLCQTLGLDNPERNQFLKKSALIIALFVMVGFISVPCAVFLGVLKEGTEVALLAH